MCNVRMVSVLNLSAKIKNNCKLLLYNFRPFPNVIVSRPLFIDLLPRLSRQDGCESDCISSRYFSAAIMVRLCCIHLKLYTMFIPVFLLIFSLFPACFSGAVRNMATLKESKYKFVEVTRFQHFQYI